MTQRTQISLALSEDGSTATVRFSSRSTPIVCGVLGIESTEGGLREVYLSARIHRDSKTDYEGWEPRGAISTILTELP